MKFTAWLIGLAQRVPDPELSMELMGWAILMGSFSMWLATRKR